MKAETDKGWGWDTYSGNWKELEKTFPDLADERDLSMHEHNAVHGGFYMHSHRGGRNPHAHAHDKCEWCR